MHYAPENELGVVFLFADYAKKRRFRVEAIRPSFPDCIAYKKVGGREKRVRIEFELKSRNFKAHRHSPRGCDCIVCWEDNWPGAPPSLQIIELRREYGLGRNVWIQSVAEDYKNELSRTKSDTWSVAPSASKGDLVLFYRTSPDKCIKDLYRLTGPARKTRTPGWKKGTDFMAPIRLVCRLKAPVFLEDLQRHRALKTAGFVRGLMRGRPKATEYWPDLHDLIVRRNPSVKKALQPYV
jgi:hypothetical protein